MHRTRSRLGPAPVPGKAVYLTMPVPADAVRPRSGTVPAVAEQIRDMLAARGIGPLQMSADRDIAVICVRAGTHVWVRERFIHCRLSGPEATRHAPYDRVEVVERVVRHCADQDAAPRSGRLRENPRPDAPTAAGPARMCRSALPGGAAWGGCQGRSGS